MNEWDLDFEWGRVRNYLKEVFNRKTAPDLQEILFIIGIQELGRVQDNFTKEEKQDLIHIATCELLSKDGFYEFKGRDQDGWPHYEHTKHIPLDGLNAQEIFLKEKITDYFRLHINEVES